MNEIRISVIVPAYNIEQYIARCLDSLLAQTYRNLQIIVVDDGSSDQTGAIIDEYSRKDRRVMAIHQENQGVSKARLTGLDKAEGTYIGFTDGDDIVEPEMYEHLLRNALKHQADISHCGYKMVFPDGHENLYYGTGKIGVHNHDEGLKELLAGDFFDPGLWNKLYRASLIQGFQDSSLWDSGIRLNEDLLMNYIVFNKAKKTVYEDVVLYRYMLRKDSAATSSIQHYKIIDPLKVITIIKDDTREDKELHAIAYDRYLRTLINTSQQEVIPEAAEQAREQLKKEMKNRESFFFDRSAKLRLMAFGAARMPKCYRMVRKIYDKKTGVGTKYKV